MPAADTATGEVSLTSSPVDDGHCLASCDNYVVRMLRVSDHQAPCAIKSPFPRMVLQRESDQARSRTIIYTITIDRVYDSKA